MLENLGVISSDTDLNVNLTKVVITGKLQNKIVPFCLFLTHTKTDIYIYIIMYVHCVHEKSNPLDNVR